MAVREIDTRTAASSVTPQFKDNPIGAVGLVLSNVSAGIRGQELPTTGLRREQAAQKDQELRQLGLTLQYAEQTVDMFSGVDRNDPEVAGQLQKWTDHISQFLPEIGDVVSASFELSDAAGQNVLRNAGDYAEFLQRDCPGLDGNCMKKALSNPQTRAGYDEEIDQNNLQPISKKFQSIAEAVGGDNELRKIMGEDEKWSVGELRQLPPPFNFTESELRTISRNEDVQSELIPFGLEPTEIAFAAAEAEATRADETIVRLQRQRDDAISAGDTKAAQEIQDEIDKRGAIVGRTPEDVAVTGPISAKRTGEVREGLRAISGNIEELQITLAQFEDTPLAGGAIGAILDKAAGILGQFDQVLGTDLESALPGDQKKIKEARTSAKFTAALMLSTITGEDSGRFTDTERKIADQALATLEASSGPGQISTAMNTAVRIMERSLRRFADELFVASKIDLSDVNNLEKAHGILLENGLSSGQADGILLDVLEQRGIVLE